VYPLCSVLQERTDVLKKIQDTTAPSRSIARNTQVTPELRNLMAKRGYTGLSSDSPTSYHWYNPTTRTSLSSQGIKTTPQEETEWSRKPIISQEAAKQNDIKAWLRGFGDVERGKNLTQREVEQGTGGTVSPFAMTWQDVFYAPETQLLQLGLSNAAMATPGYWTRLGAPINAADKISDSISGALQMYFTQSNRENMSFGQQALGYGAGLMGLSRALPEGSLSKLLGKARPEILEVAEGESGAGKLGGLPDESVNIPKGKVPPIEETPPVEPIRPISSENIPPTGTGKVPTPEDSIKSWWTKVEGQASKAEEVTEQLKTDWNAKRFGTFQNTLEDLRLKGVSAEDAIKQATGELTGKMPFEKINLEQVVDATTRDQMFTILTQKLKGAELESGSLALKKLLETNRLPYNPDAPYGAYNLLKKAFGVDVVDAMVDTGKKLGSTGEPLPIDENIANYLRNLPEGGRQAGFEGGIPYSGKTAPVYDFGSLEPGARVKVYKALQKAGVNAIDALGIPKALKFAFDMSYMFRQLGIAGVRHPITWLKTWKRYFNAMRSSEVASKLNNEIFDLDGARVTTRFNLDPYKLEGATTWMDVPEGMASKLAKSIPGVEASNRGAAVASNYFMVQVAKDLEKVMTKMGSTEPEFVEMGSFINQITGRGTLPKWMQGTAGDLANKIFTSPRYVASRFEWPTKIFSASKAVRQEAASTMAAAVAAGAGALTIAQLAGADVELDPRSPEAYKIKVGNKRIDIWVGYAQIARALTQMFPYVDKNGKVDWTKGSRKLTDGSVVSVPRNDVINRFLQSKESPAIGSLISLMTGQTYTGEKLEGLSGVGTFFKEMLTPAVVEEIADAYFLEGPGSAALSGIGVAGIGVNTYEDVVGNTNKEFNSIPGVMNLGVKLGEASNELAGITLNTKEQEDYQKAMAAFVTPQIKSLMSSDFPLTDDEQSKWGVPTASQLPQAEYTSAVKSRLSKFKDQFKYNYIMTSNITQPQPNDTPEVSFQRYDLNKVKRFLSDTQSIQDPDVLSKIRKLMRQLDPDLDVALKLTGIYTSADPATEKARSLLSKRNNGVLERANSSYDLNVINQVRKTLEPYYKVPEDEEIENKVYGMLSPQERTTLEQVLSLEKTDKYRAHSLLYQSKSIRVVQARQAIARYKILASRKKVALRRNPVLDRLLTVLA
jgi:hypothetical protein